VRSLRSRVINLKGRPKGRPIARFGSQLSDWRAGEPGRPPIMRDISPFFSRDRSAAQLNGLVINQTGVFRDRCSTGVRVSSGSKRSPSYLRVARQSTGILVT
jgi:hypothetical protein